MPSAIIGAIRSGHELITNINSHITSVGIAENSSIENYIIENAANFSVSEYEHKLTTTNLLSDPATATDPSVLFEVQKSILDYGLQVSLASTLTRKALSAVEGLLKT